MRVFDCYHIIWANFSYSTHQLWLGYQNDETALSLNDENTGGHLPSVGFHAYSNQVAKIQPNDISCYGYELFNFLINYCKLNLCDIQPKKQFLILAS